MPELKIRPLLTPEALNGAFGQASKKVKKQIDKDDGEILAPSSSFEIGGMLQVAMTNFNNAMANQEFDKVKEALLSIMATSAIAVATIDTQMGKYKFKDPF